MLIPKKTKLEVYNHIFNEGVIAVEDNAAAPKHCELAMPNLHVMKLCQSLASKGYLKKRYSWKWYYYFLTNEGIVFLREYLGNLPEDVKPKTQHQTASRPPISRPLAGDREGRGFGNRRFDRAPRGEGEGYRRNFDKKEGAPQGFKPEFGAGRGRAAN